ncbi:MAG: phosphate ABC transporter ATP-binding protein [Bdellovibrio sp.]|nr:phosphate ABC transporter ATP-binding protein [Bdellovibrio sp.]
MNQNKYPWVKELGCKPCCELKPKIKIKNLSLSYGKRQIFEDINLEINTGCVTGIIGPSACGKSSFISCLNRMIEVVPSAKVSGDVLIDGKSIFDSRLDLNELRKKVGIVFQEPTPLPLSIESNIILPLKEHKFDHISERVEKALRDVGLWNEVKNILKEPANYLSGGQKQRLCMARTIALGPEIILMDEPCSSLDPISTDVVEKLIHDLKGKYTIIIITHNLAQARRVCDFVATFWYDGEKEIGQIIEFGRCIDIFENPKNKIVQDYVGGLKG